MNVRLSLPTMRHASRAIRRVFPPIVTGSTTWGDGHGAAQQRGAALVVAMLILLLLSMISLSSANQSILQERMASNQHTQANSFLAAEAGITAAEQVANDAAIKEAVSSGDADAIESAWAAKISQYENWTGVGDDTGAAEFRISRLDGREDYWDEDTKTIDVLSQGRLTISPHHGARRALGARIRPGKSGDTTSSPFLSALLGREGISISGSGQIDTYNSEYGAYDEDVSVDGDNFKNNNSKTDSNKLEGISARTCTLDATINLSGGSPIYGDVLGIGNLVSQGGPRVYGNVRVNGDVDFNGYIYGKLTAGGSVRLGTNTNITGALKAGGDVEVLGGAYGKPPSIRAGGTITYPSYYSPSLVDEYIGGLSASELDIDPVDRHEAACSSKQNNVIDKKFSEVRNDARTLPLSDWLTANDCALDSCFSKSNGDIKLDGNNKSLALGTFGEQTLLEVPGTLRMTGSLAELDIRGDVTLLVGRDFNLGTTTTLDMGSTATLTLLVAGKATFGRGSDIALEDGFVRENSVGESVPAILVYTSYESHGTSDAGVTLSGDNDSYIAVYAPDASVDVGASGDIYGSVVANEIEMSGDGAIHFDEALKGISFGESQDSESTGARIVSWRELTTIQ